MFRIVSISNRSGFCCMTHVLYEALVIVALLHQFRVKCIIIRMLFVAAIPNRIESLLYDICNT
jgi:hypothetical protein